MKELAVLCHFYIKVDDDYDINNAEDTAFCMVDADCDLQIYETELREV